MAEIDVPGFEVSRMLGGGGFGTVWLARQPSVDRDVAIKIGHRPLHDHRDRLRFERECRALGRLSEFADIVTVHVAGLLDDGRPYLVMEYVAGGTLWDRVEQGPVPAGQLAGIGAGVCEALGHAHDAGILHRDIKPENILLRADGSMVLGDFGIAVLRDGAASSSASITATVPFTAPEILTGDKATVASDLYAVGATILAAATGVVPFTDDPGEGFPAILNRVLTADPPDLRTFGHPDALALVVERLMAKDPAGRPATADEAAELFRSVLGVLDGSAGAAGSGTGRDTVVADLAARSRTVAAVTPGTVAVGTGAGGVGAGAGSDRSGVETVAASVSGSGRRWRRGALPAALVGMTVVIAAGAALSLAWPSDPDDDGSVVADGDREEAAGLAGGPVEVTTTTAPAEPGTTLTNVTLGPIGLPLVAADAGLPDNSSIESFVPDAGEHGFCNIAVDETGMVAQELSFINDYYGADHVLQHAVQWDSSDSAARYLEEIRASMVCSSWDQRTIDGTQGAVHEAFWIEPVRRFGDETVAWHATTTFDHGLVVQRRGYIVRVADRVVSIGVSSDETFRLDQVPDLMALALERLGYGG